MPDVRPRPVLLTILDGLGERTDIVGNAVKQARTPNLDRWRSSCPTVWSYARAMSTRSVPAVPLRPIQHPRKYQYARSSHGCSGSGFSSSTRACSSRVSRSFIGWDSRKGREKPPGDR